MHCIHYVTFDENTSTKEIESTVQDWALRYSDSGGLCEAIRFVDKVFDDRKKAESYIKAIDHTYGNFAVKFKCAAENNTSAKLKDLNEKFTKAHNEYYALRDACHFKTITSAFIGCKNCGSKLSREHLVRKGVNGCPMCGAELRPQTVLDRISKKKADLENITKAIEKEQNRLAKTKGVVKWLVKYEYHC